MDLVSILVAGTLVLLPAADYDGCWNYLLDLVNLERRMPEIGSEEEEYASEKNSDRDQGFMLQDTICVP